MLAAAAATSILKPETPFDPRKFMETLPEDKPDIQPQQADEQKAMAEIVHSALGVS